MPDITLRLTEEFQCGLANVYSDRVLEQVHQTLENLKAFPDMGSAAARPCLTRRFGPTIRTLPISTFVLVYRHVDNYVDILALEPGSRIR